MWRINRDTRATAPIYRGVHARRFSARVSSVITRSGVWRQRVDPPIRSLSRLRFARRTHTCCRSRRVSVQHSPRPLAWTPVSTPRDTTIHAPQLPVQPIVQVVYCLFSIVSFRPLSPRAPRLTRRYSPHPSARGDSRIARCRSPARVSYASFELHTASRWLPLFVSRWPVFVWSARWLFGAVVAGVFRGVLQSKWRLQCVRTNYRLKQRSRARHVAGGLRRCVRRCLPVWTQCALKPSSWSTMFAM